MTKLKLIRNENAVKHSDNSQVFTYMVLDDNDNLVNLTGLTVTARFGLPDGSVFNHQFSLPATVDSDGNAVITIGTAAARLLQPDEYAMELWVYKDGTHEIYPSDDYAKIEITREIATYSEQDITPLTFDEALEDMHTRLKQDYDDSKAELQTDVMAELQDPQYRGEQGEKGEPGQQGEPGETGADGLTAYQAAQNNGFTGTEAEWLASLKGEQGPALDGAVVLSTDGVSTTARDKKGVFYNTVTVGAGQDLNEVLYALALTQGVGRITISYSATNMKLSHTLTGTYEANGARCLVDGHDNGSTTQSGETWFISAYAEGENKGVFWKQMVYKDALDDLTARVAILEAK